MLFDNNDLDLTFLNLAGINTSNITGSQNNNLFSVKEGFLRGNMFKGEYVPYRNLTFINIVPKNDREAKLFNVMQYSFAINDLNLYLDLHPEDKIMLNKFKELVMEEEKAKKEYENSYGPLEVCDVTGNDFKWINGPWSWESVGGSMYV